MTLSLCSRRVLLSLSPIMLAACAATGLIGNASPKLPALAVGAHALIVNGDAGNARVGTAFVGSNGAAYVALGDESDRAMRVVYRRSDGAQPWQRAPMQGDDIVLTTALDEALPVTAWVQPKAATRYETRIGERTLTFTLTREGRLVAGDEPCKLSGAIGAADLANAARVSLTLSGCAASDGAARGAYSGIAYVDPEAPNAAFRVIVDNGTDVQDFYTYAP